MKKVLATCFWLLAFGIFATCTAAQKEAKIKEAAVQRWDDLVLYPRSHVKNPSFLAELNHISARAVLTPTLGNAFMGYEYGATTPIGEKHSAGFTVFGSASNNPIQITRWDEDAQSFVADGVLYYDNPLTLMWSYANKPIKNLWLGTNLSYFRIPNFGEPISGLGIDIGAAYQLLDSPDAQLLADLNFQNILSPDFWRPDGIEMRAHRQPMNIKIGGVSYFYDRQFTAGINIGFNDLAASGEGAFFDFCGNVGVWIFRLVKFEAIFGMDYYSLGGVVNFPFINCQAGYEFTDFTEHAAAFRHKIFLRGLFGPHRNTLWARRGR